MPKFAGWEYNIHIMGLADRLKAYQTEQAGHQAAEAEAARRALAQAQQQRLQTFTFEQQRLAAEELAKRALVAQLEPLLEVVGAREQLEEARKIWGGGQVDSTSVLTRSATLSLALRYRRLGYEEHRRDDSEADIHQHIGSSISYIETGLIVHTAMIEGIPLVWAAYGSRQLESSGFSEGGHSYSGFGEGPFKNESVTKPEQFALDKSSIAQRILENQLFTLLSGQPIPSTLNAQSRNKILADEFTSLKNPTAYRKGFEKLISQFNDPGNPSQPLYRRILG